MAQAQSLIKEPGMKRLANITDGLIGQPMFNILAKAQEMERAGRHIIHFEIGDPNFNSPPHAISAVKDALDNNLTHYTDSMGMFEFRESIADYVKNNWKFQPDISQILVAPANAVIDFVVRCTVNPGEEVIYPDPGFPTYYSVINYNGMIPVGIKLREENNFRMNPEDIRSRLSDKTKLIIINSPQNPTGSVMTEDEIMEIAKIAEERDIYLFSDEIYAQITYNDKHFSPSIVDQCRERTIINYSLSKNYSMSGWRLGFAIGPESLIRKMGLLFQTIFSCLPPFLQAGGIATLSGSNKFLIERTAILKKRRAVLISGLNSLPKVSCKMPEGAFYAFANISETKLTGFSFCEMMLEKAGVCLCPGECFGEFGNGYVRLSYGSVDDLLIESAIKKMRDVLRLDGP